MPTNSPPVRGEPTLNPRRPVQGLSKGPALSLSNGSRAEPQPPAPNSPRQSPRHPHPFWRRGRSQTGLFRATTALGTKLLRGRIPLHPLRGERQSLSRACRWVRASSAETGEGSAGLCRPTAHPFVVSRPGVCRRGVSNHTAHSTQARRRACPEPVEGACPEPVERNHTPSTQQPRQSPRRPHPFCRRGRSQTGLFRATTALGTKLLWGRIPLHPLRGERQVRASSAETGEGSAGLCRPTAHSTQARRRPFASECGCPGVALQRTHALPGSRRPPGPIALEA